MNLSSKNVIDLALDALMADTIKKDEFLPMDALLDTPTALFLTSQLIEQLAHGKKPSLAQMKTFLCSVSTYKQPVQLKTEYAKNASRSEQSNGLPLFSIFSSNNNPEVNVKTNGNFCGFKPGFLIGKKF